MVLYIVISFWGTLEQFNDFNSNSSICFCCSSLFINACRSLSSFLCCSCYCSSFCCCTSCSSILCCLSSLFYWWSIWTLNICTIVFLEILHYWITEIFVISKQNWQRIFMWKKREQSQKTVITVFFSTHKKKGRDNNFFF